MVKFQFLPKISWRKTIFLGFTSLLALFIIFKTTVNIRSFSAIISQIDIRYFWLAFATIPPSLFLNAARWYYVLRASGFLIKFRRIFIITMSSFPFVVIPGRLGDLVRSYPLRHEAPVSQTIATIILEKIIDVCTLLIYSGIGLFMLRYYYGSAVALFAAIASIPGLIILKKIKIISPTKNKLVQKIYGAAEILDRVHERKNLLGMAVVCSMINMGFSLLAFYWLMIAVKASVPFAAILAFMPLGTFIGLIPLTLAGMGTRDAAMIHFFRPYAMPSQSLSASLLYALQGYWIVAILCLPFLLLFLKEKPPMATQPEN